MNKKNLIIAIILLIIIILLAYPIINHALNPNKSKNEYSDSSPKWTVMIYMAGDNWLSEMIPKNIGHMKSVGSSEEVTIIALVDEKGSNNTHLYKIEIYEATEFNLTELNEDYVDELNTGNKNTLKNFVVWAMNNYPAKYYFLDIWGHGKGWTGVAMDGSDYLNMQELESALKDIVENSEGKKLDIIGFDACYMSTIEVLYQVKDYADFAVASEKDIPKRGWPYYTLLMELRERPDISPKELSILIVDHYYNGYASGEIDNSGFSVSLAAVDLGKIDGIVNNLDFIETEKGSIESYERSDYVDLYHYAQINKLDKLMNGINESIIVEKHWVNTKGVNINHACGIGIYYPDEYDSNYEKVKLAIDTEWDEGLKNIQ